MSESAGFNMEDLITPQAGGKPVSLPSSGAVLDFKAEGVKGKLRKLQQGNEVLGEEVKELQSVSDSLQKELAALETEAYKLEEIQKEKEELCRKLHTQCEESEQECTRQLNQNKKNEDLLEQYRCEIQETKLKHRKQRMKFENQLHQLMEQHKNLFSVFSPERLPVEVLTAESTNNQLLVAEQVKLAQLHRLSDALEEVKQQQQPGLLTLNTLAET